MPVFTKADALVCELVDAVLEEHHQRLVEFGVSLDVLMAHARTDSSGNPKGPALKHHGVPCLATIKITSHKERVAGLADAILTIDGDRWGDLPEGRQRALIDHELTHLVTPKEHGGESSDDSGRPVLKMRGHDVETGFFYEVVERHGEAAVETEVYKGMHQKFSQLLLPWG